MPDKEEDGMDMIVEELGQTLFGLLAGGAVFAMFIGLLNFASAF